jgi:hypothetical protein
MLLILRQVTQTPNESVETELTVSLSFSYLFPRPRESLIPVSSPILAYGTITTPTLPACPTTLRAIPSRLNPLSLVSECLIFAISYTCFKLTVPTVPLTAFPTVGLFVIVHRPRHIAGASDLALGGENACCAHKEGRGGWCAQREVEGTIGANGDACGYRCTGVVM